MVTTASSPSSPDTPAGSAVPWRVLAYAGAVAALGIVLLAVILAVQLPRLEWTSPDLRVSYLLGGLLFVGELQRLRVVRRDGDSDRLTISSTFAVALVMTGPLCLAVLAQVISTALDDVRRKRSSLVVLFNVGQYALTLTAVRLTFALPQGHEVLAVDHLRRPIELGPAIAAALVYFVANNVIVGVVVALDSRQSLYDVLREDLRIQGMDSTILLGLAPITAVISYRAMALVPLIVLPLLGVQRNALIAARRQHESLHDDLTGLPNRTLFRLRAERALTVAPEHDVKVAVMLIDLDHFKEVNDTLGHHVGDGLLRQVAERLTTALPGLSVARLGGDEFAVIVPHVQAIAEVVALAEQAMASLREPLMADGVRLGVQASIGVALYPDHAGSITTLLQRADVALYQAKGNRGTVQLYRPEQDTHSIRRLSLHADLHASIDSDDLSMSYQPQVDAGTGALVGIEALMRWKHPVHGDVSPDTFIPLAENSGMIGPLTRRAVTASLATLSDLRTEGHDLTVAVNLSPRLLTDLDVPHWLRDCLDADRIPPARLTVEVTESSISADPKRAMRVLAELRDLGVRIAIDDFGTGYSSLSYLTKLQPDDLKIDKGFVIRMRTDDDSAVIVRSTIELAHGLGLQVIAEGVEDQATYDALAGLGCDRVQGFHVARPMPADVLAGWASQPRSLTGPSWTTRQGSAHGEVVPLRRLDRSSTA